MRVELCTSRLNPPFKEIVSRPSLLFIVATLWNRENLSARAEQINSAMIIDLFIRHSYRRQGAKQSERNFMALNTAERAYFMHGIAVFMGQQFLPNQISLNDLNNVVEKLIESIPDDVSRSVGAAANEESQPLRSLGRFDWEHRKYEILEHIKTDVRACGILVSDLSKDGTFKFAHKSFMEFLQASYIFGLISKEQASFVSSSAIKSKMNFSMARPKSPEVLMFLSELIASQNPENKSSSYLIEVMFDVIVVGSLDETKFEKWIRRQITYIYIGIIAIISRIKNLRLRSYFIRSIFFPSLMYPLIIMLFFSLVLIASLLLLDFLNLGDGKNFYVKNIALIFAVSLGVFSSQLMFRLRIFSGSLKSLADRLMIFHAICTRCKISEELIRKFARIEVVQVENVVSKID